MGSVILQADTLNLPSVFARRYHGLSLRIVDDGERLVITPVQVEQAPNKLSDTEGSSAKSLARYERLIKKYNLQDCPITNSLVGIANDPMY
jgi:hypothetical protein